MMDIILQSKVELYVPGTMGVNVAADTSDYVNKTAQNFCEWFGGATAEESNGYWNASNGETVFERVTRVWAYCTTNQLEDHIIQVYEWAQTICRELRQEAVSVVVNGQMHLIGVE